MDGPARGLTQTAAPDENGGAAALSPSAPPRERIFSCKKDSLWYNGLEKVQRRAKM